MDENTSPELLEKQLEQWRDVGNRLWPFVRFFALCGGDIRAIEAVSDLAGLLGIKSESHLERVDTANAVRDTVQAVREHFETRWFRKMLRKDAESYLKELEELA